MTEQSHLSPKVLKQLTRLKGRVPDDFAPREVIVKTPVGERPIPACLQALEEAVFPAGHVMVSKDEFEWEVNIGGFEVGSGLVNEERAWYAIGHDDGQFYFVVDLDKAVGKDDPLTYRVDHEGDQEVSYGLPLSGRLAKIKTKRPPAKKYAFAIACANGDLDGIRAGLAAGTSLGPVNNTGTTPLHLAALCSGSPEAVRLLLEAGADVNAVVTGEPRMQSFAENERLFGRNLMPCDTPLYAALSGFDYWVWKSAPVADEIARILIDGGADLNLPTRSGVPLFSRLLEIDHKSVAELVGRALTTGAEARSEGEDSPLRVAAYHRDPEVARLLLKAGADPCRPTGYASWGIERLTPLHAAAYGGRDEVLRLLAEAASDVDVRNPQGMTALHIACLRGSRERVRILLEAGADREARLTDPSVVAHIAGEGVADTPVKIAQRLGNAGVLEELGISETHSGQG